jgi:hypothetical protein
VTGRLRRLGTCLAVTAAALTAPVSCVSHHGVAAQPKPSRQSVLVEEYGARIPVGTVLHLCLAHLPCRTTRITADGRRNPPQLIALPLPPGVSSREADGWPLRAYAVPRAAHGARGRAPVYGGRTRLVYHISVDPECACAGDYAYLRLSRSAR